MRTITAKFSIVSLALLLTATLSCSKGEDKGILGIRVPVGDGKVARDAPYVISGVYKDTPAYNSGLRPDDIIIQINKVPVINGMKYKYIYENLLLGKPGEKVTLVIKRGDKNMIFDVVRGRN